MDADYTMELYTLEYQKAAERYENIYRSIWTIFSYLTAVAAGILTFGSDRIEPHGLVCVAATPLAFWFWTTYLPLDRYGHEALERLAEIESLLNGRFKTQLKHFTHFAHPLGIREGMKRAIKTKEPGGLRKQFKRARFAIVVFFLFLHFFFLYEIILFYRTGKPLFREKPPTVMVVGCPQ